MQLRPYQLKGIDFAKRHKKVYLAFDMGMGKTLTALAAGKELAKKGILVIAEKNEIVNSQNFKKEAELLGLEYVNLREDGLPFGKMTERFVGGINPDGLVKFNLDYVRELFDFVIIDEATLAKTTTTNRFKAVKKVCDSMEYVVLLSGTPMLNGASEIYAPLLLIGHPLAGNGSTEAQVFFETIFAGGHKRKIKDTGKYWLDYTWWAKGANNLRELRYLIDDRFYFIQKGESNLFKKKTRRIERVEVSMEWLAEYNAAWNEYITETCVRFKDLSPAKLKEKMANVTELQRLIENGKVYQVNSKWKAKKVVEDIKNGVYGDKKIIVFTLFVETYELILDLLHQNRIPSQSFDLGLKQFQNGPEKVLVGRIKANGKGTNVPQASVTLFVDMDFVPLNNMQAENRMDRPEQTQDMEVVYYMAEGDDMVDAHVRAINQEKMRKIEEFTRPLEPDEITQAHIYALTSKFPKAFKELENRV